MKLNSANWMAYLRVNKPAQFDRYQKALLNAAPDMVHSVNAVWAQYASNCLMSRPGSEPAEPVSTS